MTSLSSLTECSYSDTYDCNIPPRSCSHKHSSPSPESSQLCSLHFPYLLSRSRVGHCGPAAPMSLRTAEVNKRNKNGAFYLAADVSKHKCKPIEHCETFISPCATEAQNAHAWSRNELERRGIGARQTYPYEYRTGLSPLSTGAIQGCTCTVCSCTSPILS